MPNTEFGITEVKLALITAHARREPTFRFTSLHHLMNKDFLRGCFNRLDKRKAVGIDGVTWIDYAEALEENLDKLASKLRRRAYKPLPSKRVYIPKNEHETRPLGISAIETKIVESAITRILQSIYEVDFCPTSYGFRPGKSCHDAIKALDRTIMHKPIEYIVEVDIKGFFDNVSHEHMLNFLRIRIGDTAMLSLIAKFLNAGFVDKGTLCETTKGTPQGSILSPLLSNVYLHYTLDKWFAENIRYTGNGYMELIRYADDFVIATQYRRDAYNIAEAVRLRFLEYGLETHPTKSRCISFGKRSASKANCRGKKPNTFDFLGFTLYMTKSRCGLYKLAHRTQKKKFAKACKAIHEWLKSIRSQVSQKEWWPTLASKLNGHYNYYGISGNFQSIRRFYNKTIRTVRYWMSRRSQRSEISWEQFREYLGKYPLPTPKVKYVIYAH